MADTRYKGQGSQTTGHIADRPTGSEETKRGGRNPFGLASGRQDQAVGATGKQQNTDPIKNAASGKTRFITVQNSFVRGARFLAIPHAGECVRVC